MAEQTTQVQPAEARTFIADFFPDPNAVAALPDDKVLEYHGRVNTALQKHGPKAVPFGEKWREAMAGEDAEAMKTLGRFTEPGALWKSYNELRQKQSKGELKSVTPFPAEGTPEDQNAWRKEHGIPEKPEAYDTTLPGGLVIGDADKPMVDSYLKAAHAANIPNEVVKENLKWYLGTYVPEMQKAQADQDAEFRSEAAGKLREMWGADYKRNITAVTNLLNQAPEALRARIWGGRTADGNLIGDDPDIMQFFADLSLTINPVTTLTSGGHVDTAKGVNERLAELDKMMKTDRQAWNKSPELQDEYQRLVDAKERMLANARAAA